MKQSQDAFIKDTNYALKKAKTLKEKQIILHELNLIKNLLAKPSQENIDACYKAAVKRKNDHHSILLTILGLALFITSVALFSLGLLVAFSGPSLLFLPVVASLIVMMNMPITLALSTISAIFITLTFPLYLTGGLLLHWQLSPSARSQTMKGLVKSIETVNTKMLKVSNFSIFSLTDLEKTPELTLNSAPEAVV